MGFLEDGGTSRIVCLIKNFAVSLAHDGKGQIKHHVINLFHTDILQISYQSDRK